MQAWGIADASAEHERPESPTSLAALDQPIADDPEGELENDESLWQTIRGDFAATTGLKVLAVAVLMVWMAFQWGLGNDVLLPTLAAWVFDAIEDGETWGSGLQAVLAATCASFAFWAFVQALDAILMLSGFGLLPGITKRISRFLRAKGLVTPYAKMRWTTRWIIAYATGVSLLCLVDVFATGRPGFASRRRMIVTSVFLSAGTVALVVGLVATAAIVGARIPATEAGAEFLVRYAKNPLTWTVIFISVYGLSHLKSKLSSDPDQPV